MTGIDKSVTQGNRMNDPAANVFDRSLLRRRRDRAAGRFDEFAFLKHEVADRLADRLLDFQREFALAADLGGHNGLLKNALKAAPHNPVETLITTDLSARMLTGAPGPRLVMDEEALCFAPQSLSLITSIFGLHAVNDLPGTLIQAQRALVPDGLFLAALPGGDSLNELRTALGEAELEIDGGISPRVSPMVDLRDAGSLLQRAGFALPVTDVDRITIDYTDPLKLIQDLRAMGEANILNARRKAPMKKATLMRALEIYVDRYGDAEGRIPATFEIIFLTGWAPHESQQKPLRPGSAKMRLADALGTVEKPAGDKVGN